jgi:hypothetical protein
MHDFHGAFASSLSPWPEASAAGERFGTGTKTPTCLPCPCQQGDCSADACEQ